MRGPRVISKLSSIVLILSFVAAPLAAALCEICVGEPCSSRGSLEAASAHEPMRHDMDSQDENPQEDSSSSGHCHAEAGEKAGSSVEASVQPVTGSHATMECCLTAGVTPSTSLTLPAPSSMGEVAKPTKAVSPRGPATAPAVDEPRARPPGQIATPLYTLHRVLLI